MRKRRKVKRIMVRRELEVIISILFFIPSNSLILFPFSFISHSFRYFLPLYSFLSYHSSVPHPLLHISQSSILDSPSSSIPFPSFYSLLLSSILFLSFLSYFYFQFPILFYSSFSYFFLLLILHFLFLFSPSHS